VETEGPHNASGRDEPDDGATILRFPSDWFGPTEELVPFGPRANGPAVAQDEVLVDGDVTATPASGAAFWSADSAQIQDAVQGPVVPAPAPAERGWRLPRIAGSRVLVIACAGLLCLGLLGRFMLQRDPRQVSRSVTTAHVHAWTAVSHPPVATRAPSRPKQLAKAPEHHPTVRQSVSAATPESSGSGGAVPTQVAPPATSAAAASSGGGAGGPGASAASVAPSSQPTFGANGALGPGSSPNS